MSTVTGTISTTLVLNAGTVGTLRPVTYTNRLIRALSAYLAAAGVGTYRPSGAYATNEVGIYNRLIPAGGAVTLALYASADEVPGMADHESFLQVRTQGSDRDPETCDDLADKVYDALNGLHKVVMSGIHVVDIWRMSYTPMGNNTAGQWARSENYYVRTMRPTALNTD